VRLVGVVLLLVGLVAVVVGTFSGFGSLFSWNGRHAIDVVALPEGRAVRTLVPEPGRRYTASIQVTFDRGSVETREGIAVVEAKLPLVLRVKDPAGTVRAEAMGWLDPNEPPNVLYGQSAHGAAARADGPRSTELVVERLVGPFIAASNAPLSVEVDLGADRAGRARIVERRLVIYDDALPPRIHNAFVAAGAGAGVLVAGAAVLVVGWWRRRQVGQAGRKRGGIPARDVV
jgi:hypothetical protein